VWYFSVRQPGEEAGPEPEALPEVEVRPYGELVGSAVLEKVATLEPAEAAPLVARSGGRVTDVAARLGDQVSAGEIVVALDGGHEPSVARTQLASASRSLRTFTEIESAALASADQAIASAQLGRNAVAANRPLTAEQVATGREQADLAVRQAELALRDVREGDDATDSLLRAADLSLQAAELAQDQATIARQLATQQSGDALKQAEQGLTAARQAKDRLRVDLAGQRVSLEGQAALVREQVRLSQITAPLAGQVISLTVYEGDFVQPGQQVGEISAFAGARVTLDVTGAVRHKLHIGQELVLKRAGQDFTGEIVHLADGPRTQAALWQVDIFVAATPEVIHPGELVTVVLPIGPRSATPALSFIPLDAVVVRQNGSVLFSVDADGVVAEHEVTAAGFVGDYVEGTARIDEGALVVVGGNRTLKAGDKVRIRQ
jgi:multidrug efflux pump subunit AcrA (membrane-fusion protein)